MATGNFEFMSSSKGEKGPPKGLKDGEKSDAKGPEWAGGLKKLYNSVVEEPLPDSFKDLLSKLDQDEGK